tara:strand:+ start:43 stop:870 length:828 start_codon:yes stop_codon:yes gene_type:complete
MMNDLLMPPYRSEIVEDLPWQEYLDSPGMNPSWLVNGLKSMRKFRYGRYSEKPNRSMRIGSLAHQMLLEPGEFSSRYAVFDGIFNESHDAYKKWQWKNDGKDPIKPSDYDEASRIADAVREKPLAMELINETTHEVSIYCEDMGLQCKGRVDGLGPRLTDLKTTTNVEGRVFGTIFHRLHYAEKLGCYMRWAQKLGIDVQEVYVIAAESQPEYDVTVIPIPLAVLEPAWHRIERIMERIRTCVEEDNWPGVDEGGLYELNVPLWSMSDEEALDWS